MRAAIIVSVVAVVGCSSDESGATIHPSSEAVAALGTGTQGGLVIAYATSEHAAELPQILAGAQPKAFHWVTVTVAASETAQLYLPDGLTAELSNAAAHVRFAQVYPGVCNPATSDYGTCWLLEDYGAGDPGLTGTMHIILTATEAM